MQQGTSTGKLNVYVSALIVVISSVSSKRILIRSVPTTSIQVVELATGNFLLRFITSVGF